MATVKCRYCGRLIDKKDAVAVQHGSTFWYYCDGHQNLKTKEEENKDLIVSILHDVHSWSVLTKNIAPIVELHGANKTYSYIKQNQSYLERAMAKGFSSEYGKIRYFVAILRNNLPNYKIPEKSVVKDVEEIEFVPKSKKKERRSLSDLIGGEV